MNLSVAASAPPISVLAAGRSRDSWYCVHTRPKKENWIVAHLRQTMGVEIYFPRLKKQKTIRRVRRVVVGPLFPRYFFCRIDLGRHYRAIRYAPEVINIVSFGGVPVVVEDNLIEVLKSWAGDTIDILSVQPGFQMGDEVEIIDGSMRGLRATIRGDMNDRDRVAVVLSILERDVHMTIDRCQLAATA